ncbi:MAG: TIGR03013 family XrtA/PEP-CTERM system glycosyltransferase [Alphaproteobacteria bacterium]
MKARYCRARSRAEQVGQPRGGGDMVNTWPKQGLRSSRIEDETREPVSKHRTLSRTGNSGCISFQLGLINGRSSDPGFLNRQCQTGPTFLTSGKSDGRAVMMLRVFRHFIPASVLLLALCEATLIFFVWNFSLFSGIGAVPDSRTATSEPALVLALLAVCVMALSGLYHNKAFADFRIMAIQIAIAFVALLVIISAYELYIQDSFDNLASSAWSFAKTAVLTWLVCVLVTRITFSRIADLDLLKRRVVVLGAGEKAARIAGLAAAGANRYFVPVAYLDCGGESRVATAARIGPCDKEPDALVDCARRLAATEIVVATDDGDALPVAELLRCRAAGIRVSNYMDFVERQTKTVDPDALQPSWLIFSDGFRDSALAQLSKRCFDLVFALALLLFALPLMLLTALAIVLDSKGPIFYRQERVGLNGQSFLVIKFRSMRTDAEKDGAPQWAAQRDVRVTRVGALIRKLRIDELPQLLNVLRGEMSLVGPRPERPCFVEEFTREIPFYTERHCVKPGITGWAQVNYPYAASPEDARNKLAYDLYYVKNRGLFLDLIVVFHTVRVILFADGAR